MRAEQEKRRLKWVVSEVWDECGGKVAATMTEEREKASREGVEKRDAREKEARGKERDEEREWARGAEVTGARSAEVVMARRAEAGRKGSERVSGT